MANIWKNHNIFTSFEICKTSFLSLQKVIATYPVDAGIVSLKINKTWQQKTKVQRSLKYGAQTKLTDKKMELRNKSHSDSDLVKNLVKINSRFFGKCRYTGKFEASSNPSHQKWKTDIPTSWQRIVSRDVKHAGMDIWIHFQRLLA